MTSTLAFECHSRSNMTVQLDSSYIISYYGLRVTYGLTRLLYDIRLWNLSDLEFDLSVSLKVKSNSAVGFSIYDFLLVFHSNHMPIYHRVALIGTWKFTLLFYHWAKISDPQPQPNPGVILLKSNHFSLCHREVSHQKWSWLVKYFWDNLVTATQIYTQNAKKFSGGV